MRIWFKWTAIILLLFFYLVISVFLTVLPASSGMRRSWRMRATSICSRLALAIFGVRAKCSRPDRLRKSGTRTPGRLIVANHVSYIDVLVIASLTPSVFITSQELKNTPLLGMLASFGGSLFVERRSPFGLKKEISAVASTLEQGFQVVLFPEGTTSNGDQVQQFKRSLFDAAVSSRSDILPVCLRYRRINEAEISARSRDDLFYYGGVSFSRHFPRFLSLRSIDVEVVPLEPIPGNAAASRKDLAASARDLIVQAFQS